MRPILLDTNAYSDFMEGLADVVEIMANVDRIYLSSTVLGELLSGFAVGNRVAQNRLELTFSLRPESRLYL